MSTNSFPIIYNLFPRFVCSPLGLYNQLNKASDLRCDWLYLNPIHPYGPSGSLYAVETLHKLDERLFPLGWSDLAELCEKARAKGMRVMADLVLGHSASASPLVNTNPSFFQWNNGRLVHPGCKEDDGHWNEWGDLACHNFHNADLQQYLINTAHLFIDAGVSGFRCDAAYQIPRWFWMLLIDSVRKVQPDTLFFAETLGCSLEQTLETMRAGFDFAANSVCWWNGHDSWLPEQINAMRQHGIKSIGFPESHDTERRPAMSRKSGLNEEWEQYDAYKRALAVSDGVMFVCGYEDFAEQRCPVVCDSAFVSMNAPRFPSEVRNRLRQWMTSEHEARRSRCG